MVEVDLTEGAGRTVDEAATRGAADAEWVVGRVVVETDDGFRRGMGPVEEAEEVVDGFVAAEGRAEVVLEAGAAALVGPGGERVKKSLVSF